MPIHIIDTAGLHNSDDIIEQEGIRRAHTEINNADVVLLVYDANDKSLIYQYCQNQLKTNQISYQEIRLICQRLKLRFKIFNQFRISLLSKKWRWS